MSQTISLDKQYTTRAGEEVIILSVKGPGEQPVVGHINGCSELKVWSLEGKFYRTSRSNMDLVEKPEEVTVAVRVRDFGDGAMRIDAQRVTKDAPVNDGWVTVNCKPVKISKTSVF